MANQLNFGNPIQTLIGERMYRPFISDQENCIKGEKTNIFGTNPNDNIEVWFYRPDGSLAGNIRLSPEHPSITLSTVLDSEGAFEFANLDLEKVVDEAKLEPGRYVMAVYFLRDEVGSLNGYRLNITEISPSRTEIVLTPEVVNEVVSHDINEFVHPTVPRIMAKALVDQIFAKNLDMTNQSSIAESVNILNVSNTMNNIQAGTMDRINRSNSLNLYQSLFETVKLRTYEKAIEYMKDDYNNLNVQRDEIKKYISDALNVVLYEIKSRNELDSKFELL